MDLNVLPNELLHLIISYLDIKSAKHMCLTSKKMNMFALSRLWLKPRFSSMKDLDFLKNIRHFPIFELHSKDFDCS